MQHERVDVTAELRYNERHSLTHKARNEMHIARQAIQPGHHDVGTELLGFTKGCRELWALLQGIRAFSSSTSINSQRLLNPAAGEPDDGVALRLQAKAAPALAIGGNSVICDDRGGHRESCNIYTGVYMLQIKEESNS